MLNARIAQAYSEGCAISHNEGLMAIYRLGVQDGMEKQKVLQNSPPPEFLLNLETKPKKKGLFR